MKRRVKYRLIGYSDIRDGYLIRNKMYKEGYGIISLDGRNGYSVSLLSMIKVIDNFFLIKDTFSFGIDKEFLRIDKLNKIMKKMKK